VGIFSQIRGKYWSIQREFAQNRHRFAAFAADSAKSDRLLGVCPTYGVYYDAAERASFSQTLAGEMRFAMEDKGIDRLILLGDFNMNPYDRGINLAAGLNAVESSSHRGKRASSQSIRAIGQAPIRRAEASGHAGEQSAVVVL